MSPFSLRGLTVVAAVVGVACGGPQVPGSPTAVGGMSPLPVSTAAIPIILGETIRHDVSLSDPSCETRWEPEPCRRFSVAIPRAGMLRVRVTSPGPTGLTLWLNGLAFWGSTREITATGPVLGESTYELDVSIHDAHGTSQTFELTTSLEAN